MSEALKPCQECGMLCDPGEYHPYAACLMFKGCFDSEKVRANLEAVRRSADERDAARYRFIRDANNEVENMAIMAEDALDAAIDAELARLDKGEKK